MRLRRLFLPSPTCRQVQGTLRMGAHRILLRESQELFYRRLATCALCRLLLWSTPALLDRAILLVSGASSFPIVVVIVPPHLLRSLPVSSLLPRCCSLRCFLWCGLLRFLRSWRTSPFSFIRCCLTASYQLWLLPRVLRLLLLPLSAVALLLLPLVAASFWLLLLVSAFAF